MSKETAMNQEIDDLWQQLKKTQTQYVDKKLEGEESKVSDKFKKMEGGTFTKDLKVFVAEDEYQSV